MDSISNNGLCGICKKFAPNSQDNCEIVSGLNAFSIRNSSVRVMITDCIEFDKEDDWKETMQRIMETRKIALEKLAHL